MFSRSRTQWLLGKRSEEADNLVRYLCGLCSDGGRVVNVRTAAQHYSGSVMRRRMFDRRFYGMKMVDPVLKNMSMFLHSIPCFSVSMLSLSLIIFLGWGFSILVSWFTIFLKIDNHFFYIFWIIYWIQFNLFLKRLHHPYRTIRGKTRFRVCML